LVWGFTFLIADGERMAFVRYLLFCRDFIAGLFEFYTLIAQQNKASHHCIALSGDVRLIKPTLHTGGINWKLTHTGAQPINLF